jgi:hypothetical protein
MDLLDRIKEMLCLVIEHHGDKGKWDKWARRFTLGIDKTWHSALEARPDIEPSSSNTLHIRWDAADAAMVWSLINTPNSPGFGKHAEWWIEEQIGSVYSRMNLPPQAYKL